MAAEVALWRRHSTREPHRTAQHSCSGWLPSESSYLTRATAHLPGRARPVLVLCLFLLDHRRQAGHGVRVVTGRLACLLKVTVIPICVSVLRVSSSTATSPCQPWVRTLTHAYAQPVPPVSS